MTLQGREQIKRHRGREMAGSKARQCWTVSSCCQKVEEDWGAGFTSERWSKGRRKRGGW